MEEKVKCLALVGAGALLGSVTTIALLRLLTRSFASQSSRKVTDSGGNGLVPETAAKRHDVCGNQNHGKPSLDLLKDEIVSEQLTRNVQFFGMASQRNVSASYVVVIGLGGVGSHAASMLLRSGVGRLLLVDFDQVSLSSLNRHAVATREDVGIPKAHCLKKHFLSIFPESLVEAKVLLYNANSEEEILSGDPDFVLDCIDNIDTKVALLAACVRRGLKVLSATGAGARADPTRIRVADLRESTNDPLSRAGSGIMWNKYDFPVFLLSDNHAKKDCRASFSRIPRFQLYVRAVMLVEAKIMVDFRRIQRPRTDLLFNDQLANMLMRPFGPQGSFESPYHCQT